MPNSKLNEIVSHFKMTGDVESILPLGKGLINDTYKVVTRMNDTPNYVLQRINDKVFTNVSLLQRNVDIVTRHIRKKLEEEGEKDIDRKVLTFIQTDAGNNYLQAADATYWRMSLFIERAHTYEAVNPSSSKSAGLAFGRFESMLSDLSEPLGETIPGFHDMELRLKQFDEALNADKMQRRNGVQSMVDELKSFAYDMCKAERLHREGLLPKRVCHCDTKVNNMMFDDEGNVLLVIDLDTVMSSYVFSDYGDFLRTAANTVAEDEKNLSKVAFRMDIFKAFTEGYIQSTRNFLLPVEKENLPYAAALFPYMQSVRFLTDYLNGDVYWKTEYPEHNLTRATNQLKLFHSVKEHEQEMANFIRNC